RTKLGSAAKRRTETRIKCVIETAERKVRRRIILQPHGWGDLHPEKVKPGRNNDVTVMLIIHDAVAVLGDEFGRRDHLELKLIPERLSDAIGEKPDCLVRVLVRFKRVRCLGVEAPRPGIGHEKLVRRVKIITVSGIETAGIVEIWFGQIFQKQRRSNRKARRGFISDAERAFEIDVVTLAGDALEIINSA